MSSQVGHEIDVDHELDVFGVDSTAVAGSHEQAALVTEV